MRCTANLDSVADEFLTHLEFVRQFLDGTTAVDPYEEEVPRQQNSRSDAECLFFLHFLVISNSPMVLGNKLGGCMSEKAVRNLFHQGDLVPSLRVRGIE